MSVIEIEKIVVIGWDNFTASLVEGIKKKYPMCEILCADSVTDQILQAKQQGLISDSPSQKIMIYEGADFVIINQSSQEIIATIKNIKSLLSRGTYIIDFQPVKSKLFEEILDLLESQNPYVSCFVFLNDIPNEFTIRGDVFKDQIVAIISDTSTKVLQTMREFWNIVDAKIVPTSAEFFDEILSQTSQSVALISHMFTHILQEDSWADTLFFGFYNKDLRNFLTPTCTKKQYSAQSIIENADNIRRTLSFIKREIDVLDQMIDNEDIMKLSEYLVISQNFKNRL